MNDGLCDALCCTSCNGDPHKDGKNRAPVQHTQESSSWVLDGRASCPRRARPAAPPRGEIPGAYAPKPALGRLGTSPVQRGQATELEACNPAQSDHPKN